MSTSASPAYISIHRASQTLRKDGTPRARTTGSRDGGADCLEQARMIAEKDPRVVWIAVGIRHEFFGSCWHWARPALLK